MSQKNRPKSGRQVGQITSRKESRPGLDPADSLSAWTEHYLKLAVTGVRSEAVRQKITLHLERFREFFVRAYGHEQISACLRRDVQTWLKSLTGHGMAAATVNNHLASLSGWASWVHAQAPGLFARGDPAKGIGELPLPPLEPRALSDSQVRSLKSLCDRLPRLHALKGRRWHGRDDVPVRSNARPWRDRALVFLLLSTGLRREEAVQLDLDQLEPSAPDALRQVRRARIVRAQGKGKSERTVFLSQDAREAVADYLERERGRDHEEPGGPLFVSAIGLPARSKDGRMSSRAINLVLEQIGRWHDAEVKDDERKVSPLRPHNLRHTFAFQLARVTGADAYELERRLGHRSQRYIQRYTNPPEAEAAAYVEEF